MSTWEGMDTLVSDHYGVCTTMHFDHIQRDEFKPKWLMERANWPAFTSTIADLIQTNTHISEDINIMAHNLTETLTKAANNLHILKSKPGGPKQNIGAMIPWYKLQSEYTNRPHGATRNAKLMTASWR